MTKKNKNRRKCRSHLGEMKHTQLPKQMVEYRKNSNWERSLKRGAIFDVVTCKTAYYAMWNRRGEENATTEQNLHRSHKTFFRTRLKSHIRKKNTGRLGLTSDSRMSKYLVWGAWSWTNPRVLFKLSTCRQLVLYLFVLICEDNLIICADNLIICAITHK